MQICFVTENPQRLYLEFKIAFRCVDISGTSRGDGLLTAQGDGFYDSADGSFPYLSETQSELTFSDEEGVEQERRNIVVRAAGLVIGHRDVSHRVRYPLD